MAASPLVSHSESSLSDSSESINFDEIIKPCNWCNEANKLQSGKKFCERCSHNMFQECIRCHKPYPDERFFKNHKKRCNSCHQKILLEKKKREDKGIPPRCDEGIKLTIDEPVLEQSTKYGENLVKSSGKTKCFISKGKNKSGKVIKKNISKNTPAQKRKYCVPIILNIKLPKL